MLLVNDLHCIFRPDLGQLANLRRATQGSQATINLKSIALPCTWKLCAEPLQLGCAMSTMIVTSFIQTSIGITSNIVIKKTCAVSFVQSMCCSTKLNRSCDFDMNTVCTPVNDEWFQ